ncbi:MAG: uracil phosphoribosyltransferase [Acidimicrobiales bacterium]
MTGGVLVVEHPLVRHRLVALRDERTDSATFRQLVHEISTFVAYESLQDLMTEQVPVRTPVGVAECTKVAETVLLVPVLRAGLGMVPAVQELVPYTEVAHVGLRRDEVTLRSDVYLDRLPRDLSGRRVIVCDPMLATGGSLTQVCDLVVARGASQVQAVCLIASRPGVERFRRSHPELPVSCAAIDPELDERGFIVPGLGDAGDRLFGPPA